MPTDQILDECLEQIRQGESLDHCLAAYPQEAEVLRPLLETAAVISTVPVQHAPSAAFQLGRDRMFAVVEQEFSSRSVLQPVSENAFSRYSVRILTWITGKENIDMKFATRLVTSFIIVLVVLAALGTTAVSASNALPGDLLYPIKSSTQNIQLMLTTDTQSRLALEQRFQEEYRNDVRMLMQDGRQVSVRFLGTLDAMDNGLWIIGGLPVSIDPSTKIVGNPQLGNLVQVEAAVQKDGSILASHLALTASADHPEEHPTTPIHTPEHTPVHTGEPEHQQEDMDHSAPTGTISPTLEEQHDDFNSTPVPTGMPGHPTEPVHHDTNTQDSHDSGHSGGHE